ncbi:hypothetical protein SKAU_G00117840 [Synaphobranchus kaupii]|uniref:Neurotransmitter-gated ion-channel ligand-binding domain-containing protein n=1 Tax=Synaphobranchus kaupii TaxID=118154 RepID=A0A9Q1FN45_SYNKA|nr:hypothetical protein SKAU_G00117840 [Synaphobranchus kaupii]
MGNYWRVQYVSTTAHSKCSPQLPPTFTPGLVSVAALPHSHILGMSRVGPNVRPGCLAITLLGVLFLPFLSGAGSINAPAVIGRLGSPAPPSLSQWLRSVLEESWARLRPVRYGRSPVRVTVGFNVQNVLGMNEKQERLLLYVLYRQVWQDERFSWDPILHQGVQRVTVPAESIWVPDVVIYEMWVHCLFPYSCLRVGREEESRRSTQVSITHLGWVEQLQPRLLESRCPLNLFHFPLDHHTCNLTFVLQAHPYEVEVHWGSGLERGSREWEGSFSRGEWEMLSLTVSPTLNPLPHLHTSAVRVQVTVRRRPLLYLVTLLLPSSLLLVLDILGFLVPVHLKQRISMKASIFTGHFIFIISIFTLFPPFTRDMPLIGSQWEESVGQDTRLPLPIRALGPELVGGSWDDSLLCVSPSADQFGDTTGGGDGCPAEELQGGSLGALRRDLARVKRDLRSQREERERLSACRELGSALDRAYLYLHCLVLLTGGVVLHMQWH